VYGPWGRIARGVGGSATAEYASLTRTGAPVTVPTTPYVGEDGPTLDVTTGLTYPAKASGPARSRGSACFFADPVGSGIDTQPPFSSRPRHRARTRISRRTRTATSESAQRSIRGHEGSAPFVLQRMGWYFAASGSRSTPLRRWWPTSDLAIRLSHGRPRGHAAPLLIRTFGITAAGVVDSPDVVARRRRPRLRATGHCRIYTVIDANGFRCVSRCRVHDLSRRLYRPSRPEVRRSTRPRLLHTCTRTPRSSTGQETVPSSGASSPKPTPPAQELPLACSSTGPGRLEHCRQPGTIGNRLPAQGQAALAPLEAEAERRFQPVPDRQISSGP